MHVVFGEVACPFSGLQMMCCVRQRSAMTFSFSTRSASNKSLHSGDDECGDDEERTDGPDRGDEHGYKTGCDDGGRGQMSGKPITSTAIDGRLHDTRGCWRNERPFGLSHRMMM